MRNLLLFVLFLIGLFYARRALRGKSGNAGKAADKGPDAAGGGRQREAEHLEIEQMVACVCPKAKASVGRVSSSARTSIAVLACAGEGRAVQS